MEILTIKKIALFLLLAFPLYAKGPTQSFLDSGSPIYFQENLKLEIWKNKDLINEVLETEKELSSNYHVFYHANSNLFFYQELIDVLFKVYHRKESSDFHWLRLPEAHFFSSKEEFFNKQERSIDDSLGSTRKQLLSVNLSLFGNSDDLNCCTLAFWLLDHGVHPKLDERELIQDILNFFHLPHDYLDELLTLSAKINDRSLMQIFIPKSKGELIDNVLYFSHDRGEICQHLIEKRPSEVLEAYLTDIERIPHFKDLQGRLVLNKALLLNRESGVKMRRYDPHLTDSDIEDFKGQILKWALKSQMNQDKKIPLSN